jgi:hypothetical protein
LIQRNWTKTYRSKAGLSFNNAVRDLHLPAEGWKPHNQLNWINVMSNDNKLGLALEKKSDNNILVLAPMITK